MKLRGWNKIAEHFNRDPTTVRGWVKDKDGNTKEGCPVFQDGRAYVCDPDALAAWLDEWVKGWRKHDEPEEEVGKGIQKQLDEQTLRIKTADAEKKEADNEIRKGVTATKDEMVTAYEKGMRQVKQFVEKYIKEVKAADSEMSAAKVDKLDREMVEMFNKLASLESCDE